VTKYIYDFRGERVARIEIIGSLRDRVIGPLEEGRAQWPDGSMAR
jgi:hypothetical protein